MEWWQANGYRSRCLPPLHSEGEDDEEEEDDDDDSVSSADSASTDINYVLGDVTHPHMAVSDAIIVHCVGRRRVFFSRVRKSRASSSKTCDLFRCFFFPAKTTRAGGAGEVCLLRWR